MDWSRDFNFTVKGKEHPRIVNFNPQWRMYWTCADTGEEVWTEVSGLRARVARGGGFSSSATLFLSGLGRMLTVNLSGRFGSRTRASGSLLWSLQGCGTQLDQWSAYGPATKHKKKKKKKGDGGGGGSPGGCIWIPLPDGVASSASERSGPQPYRSRLAPRARGRSAVRGRKGVSAGFAIRRGRSRRPSSIATGFALRSRIRRPEAPSGARSRGRRCCTPSPPPRS